MRYNTDFRAAMCLGALMLAPNAGEETRAQASAAEAISLAEQYIVTHNAHI